MNLRHYFNRQQEKSVTATAAPGQPNALGDMSTTVSVSSAVASTTSGSNELSDFSTSTLPDDLLVPPVGNVAVKLDMVAKGPTQPRDCIFFLENSAMEIYLSTRAGMILKKQKAGWNTQKQ